MLRLNYLDKNVSFVTVAHTYTENDRSICYVLFTPSCALCNPHCLSHVYYLRHISSTI